jgi:hypothetical protein
MKREYFGMLFILVFVLLIFLAEYLFGEEKIEHYLYTFIIIWVLLGFYIGQYSMRFPKAF